MTNEGDALSFDKISGLFVIRRNKIKGLFAQIWLTLCAGEVNKSVESISKRRTLPLLSLFGEGGNNGNDGNARKRIGFICPPNDSGCCQQDGNPVRWTGLSYHNAITSS